MFSSRTRSILGLAPVLLLALVAGQQLAPGDCLSAESPLSVAGVPRPDQMVRIQGGPFVVPTGRIFVATGVGVTTEPAPAPFNNVSVLFDGQYVLREYTHPRHAKQIPRGLTAAAGMVITVEPANQALFGYLANEQLEGLRAGIPHASEMVRIERGSVFTVPTGRALVVSGLISASDPQPFIEYSASIHVSHFPQPVFTAAMWDQTGFIVELAPGLMAKGGAQVEVRAVPGGSHYRPAILRHLATP